MAKAKGKAPKGARYHTLNSPLLGKGAVHQRSKKAERRDQRARLLQGNWGDQSAWRMRCGQPGPGSDQEVGHGVDATTVRSRRGSRLRSRVCRLAAGAPAQRRVAHGAPVRQMPGMRTGAGAHEAHGTGMRYQLKRSLR